MNSCVIIDDESKARLLLRNMLKDVAPNINILADCDDLPNGIKAIKKHKPNIVFLDIQMPGHSGLSILDFFEEDEVTFEIVFTTGYSEFALQAFKLSAIDYLLKPINPEALQKTIEKIARKEEKITLENYKALQTNITNTNEINDKCIVVNLAGSTRFIKIKDIILLEAEGSYCKIYLTNNEKILSSKNLKHYEERLLNFPVFFRSHKSNVINLKFVKELSRSDGIVFLENKIQAQISADKNELLFEKMEQVC